MKPLLKIGKSRRKPALEKGRNHADRLLSGDLFSSLFDSAPMAVFICDKEAVIQQYNGLASEYWGRKPALGVEKHCGSLKLWLPTGEMLPHEQSPLVEVLRTGLPVTNVEVSIERPDGSRLPVLVNFAPLKDGQGKVTGAITSFIDLSYRYRAEEANLRYDVLAEAASDAIIRIDADSIIEFVNAATTRVFGHNAEDMIGQPLTVLMPEELREKHRAGLRRYLATGEPKLNWECVEVVGLHKNGRTFPLEISFGEYKSKFKRFFVGIARDITQRKEAEKALRESEENFRSLANSISQFAWMTDAEGSAFWFNDRWLEYTGTSLEQMKGWGWQVALHPASVDGVTEKLRKHIASGEPWEDTFLLRSSSGEYRWFLSRAVPIRNFEGAVVRWFGTNTDIDEVRRAEEILSLARQELEIRVQQRTAELTAALQALEFESKRVQKAQEERVKLLGQVLTSQEDERRRIARDMHDHFGQQLTALRLHLESLGEQCGDELSFGKVSEAKKIAEELDSDLGFLVWELRPPALDDLGLEAALAHYIQKWSLQFEIPVEFHVGAYDEAQLSDEAQSSLYRIAQEALNNIYKYAEAGRVNVLLETRDREVVMIVEDNGQGFRLDRENTTNTGFGLIGMRERAALVGGTLEIESAEGSGTTVFVRIPLEN
jgi:PAS domain S-box-containing protein